MSAGSSRGARWEAVRLAVLDRDGWQCQYCHKHLEGTDATADHIIPKNAGGTDDLDNLVASCRRCNGIKSDNLVARMPWYNPRWLGGLP
ncbi:HNH endonuclease [Microbacterium sp. KNMS]